MKHLFHIISLVIICALTSCESSDEKRYNAAIDFISAHSMTLDSVTNTNYSDTIATIFNDSICIGQGIDVWNHLQKLKMSLNEFKELYSDTIPRVWLKTMSDNEKAQYDQVNNNYSNTFGAYSKLHNTVREFGGNKKALYKVMNMSYRTDNANYVGIFYFDINRH